ncbi:VWA domain-containing protein [Williamsia sp.]|uniref:VWA domain-containing protein n=1 Tax=Williamsia sp. TaxID=1872085 RepID=UPI0025F60AF3|nr:VWA domain-containing protein [Williamsia sp.]
MTHSSHPDPTDLPLAPYPFTAVVGQDALKLALILCAIAPSIGGVLIRGEKGTAKSTIVRALAPLLPADGPTGAVGRVVELPIGATEDRVVGSLDVQKVLRDGDASFTPGLLSAADGGVLYIDEVNLLADHLVDVLLDAAAMGRVTVERDSVSRSYASRFVLVGTMNPEEGELRPQLLDRFGLTVAVTAPRDVDDRVEVITRRMDYDADPTAFADRWRAADESIAASIATARAAVGSVRLPTSEMRRIAAICTQLDVDGLRGDIVVARTACAHAAWRGVDEVDETDVRAAAELALPHRRRRDPFDDTDMSRDDLDSAMDAAAESAQQQDGDHDGGDGDGPTDPTDGGGDPDDDPTDPGPDDDPGSGSPAPESSSPADGPVESSDPSPTDADDAATRRDPIPVGPPPSNLALSQTASVTRTLRVAGVGDGDPGRRSPARSRRGHTVGSTTSVDGSGIHLHATVLAAAAGHGERGGGPRLRVTPADLRGAVRIGREGNLVVFTVDLSGSMTARRRLDAVSGACAALLRDSYQRRDRVAVVVLRGSSATVVVPPTRSVSIALRGLSGVSTGGRTPLAEGLIEATALVERARHTDPRRRPLVVVLTDGRATSGPDAVGRSASAAARLRTRGVDSVVVDCEQGMIRLGLARTLAGHLGGGYVAIDEITADAVTGAVRAAA